jgi:large subunit ribosomal protein L6
MQAAKLSSKYGKYMSRIGKQLIKIPSGVQIAVNSEQLTVKGPKGELTLILPSGSEVKSDGQEIKVSANSGNIHGLVRSLVNNMVKGVSEGWTKSLELNGTGYRATVAGSDLQLALGFSHPVTVKAPIGVTFEVKENKITVIGFDKQLVGQMAAKIRSLRPADPYKLKGFKYTGEIIVKKVGKAVKAAA